MLDAFRDRISPVAALTMLALAMAASASRAQTPSLIDELVKTSGFTQAEIRGIGAAPLVRELQVSEVQGVIRENKRFRDLRRIRENCQERLKSKALGS